MAGYSKYPGTLDDSTSIPISTDRITPVKAEVVNRNRDGILSIQAELGLDPSREWGTVRARLDAMEAFAGGLSAPIDIYENGTLKLSGITNFNFTGGVTITPTSLTTANIDIIGSGGGDAVYETLTVGSNGQTAFTLSSTPSDSSDVMMFVNGVNVLRSNFNVIGTSVTYSGLSLLAGIDIVEVWYLVGGGSGGGSGGSAGAADARQEIITITFDGQVAFFLGASPADVNDVEMFLNGVKIESSDYNVVSTTCTYTGPLTLEMTDVLEFWYLIDASAVLSVKTTRSFSGNDSPSSSVDHVLFVDTTSVASIITLPTGVLGKEFTIIDSLGNAGSNNITVSSGENINGSGTYLINVDYGRLTIIFNGTQWNIEAV